MKKIIIANWKQHPETLEEARALFAAESVAAQKYPAVQTAICPPTNFIKELGANGAQDVFWNTGGDNLGVQYVLVGHSDRRYPPAGGEDTDEIVNQKLKIALKSGVTPVLLVGERQKTDDRARVLTEQLSKDLMNLKPNQLKAILIAYEPVWAISTSPGSELDTPKNTLEAAAIIKNITGQETILYGGSVNQNNIADFLRHPEICGAVVGKASLGPEEFANILRTVSES